VNTGEEEKGGIQTGEREKGSLFCFQKRAASLVSETTIAPLLFFSC
jgi:hypothetical protein